MSPVLPEPLATPFVQCSLDVTRQLDPVVLLLCLGFALHYVHSYRSSPVILGVGSQDIQNVSMGKLILKNTLHIIHSEYAMTLHFLVHLWKQ